MCLRQHIWRFPFQNAYCPSIRRHSWSRHPSRRIPCHSSCRSPTHHCNRLPRKTGRGLFPNVCPDSIRRRTCHHCNSTSRHGPAGSHGTTAHRNGYCSRNNKYHDHAAGPGTTRLHTSHHQQRYRCHIPGDAPCRIRLRMYYRSYRPPCLCRGAYRKRSHHCTRRRLSSLSSQE